ncbi:MAG: Ig-like domain-containing protein [Gemmataceae bacterium]
MRPFHFESFPKPSRNAANRNQLNANKSRPVIEQLEERNLLSNNTVLLDFGTDLSPVGDGYRAVTPTTIYSPELGYGWESLDGIYPHDRWGNDPVTGDGNFAFFFDSETKFAIDVLNDTYEVTAILGGPSSFVNGTKITAEGQLQDGLNLPATNRASIHEVRFATEVNDGQLNLSFQQFFLLGLKIDTAGFKQQTAPGIRYEYYENMDQDLRFLPDFDTLTPDAVGIANSISLPQDRAEHHFGLRFQGLIEVPDDGKYTFYTRSDDGSKLYIDGELVVDNDGRHAPRERSGEVSLEAGLHEITVEFFEWSYGEVLDVSWSSSRIPKQLIPSNVLFHYAEANTPPVAVDDEAQTKEDTPVTIDVVANDVDVDNDKLTPSILTQPTNGSAVRNADGTFTYTPNENFHGTDSFTYKVSDGTDESNTATVTIEVKPVNDPPVAVDDEAKTDEDTSVTIDVVANDLDVENDKLTPTIVTQPNRGSLVIKSDGTIIYKPNLDFHGTDSFTYKVFDGTNESNTASVTVAVQPVNDPPKATDDEVQTDEDTPVSIDVLANDVDVDSSKLTPIIVSKPTSGAVFVGSNGTFVYTPNDTFHGTDSFTYKVSDGTDESNTASVTVEVKPVNDPPVAVDDEAQTDEDTSVRIDVLANDRDVEKDTLTPSLVTQPTNGSVVRNTDGTFTYAPIANFHGTDSFTYKVSDATDESNTATVTVTVQPVNDVPVAVDDEVQAYENAPVKISVLDNDTDIDGDTLKVTSATQPTKGNVSVHADGTITFDPNGAFDNLGVGQTVSETFTYTITDGNLTDTATVTVTVVKTNNVIRVTDVAQLQSAISNLKSGQTIVLAKGTYDLTDTLWLPQNINNVTIKGETGDHDDVILRGKGMSGTIRFGFWANNVDGVTFSDFTLRDLKDAGFQLNSGTHAPRISNVRIIDVNDQFIKASSPGDGDGVDEGIVEDSIFEYSTNAPDYYTNGVDVHSGDGWIIRNNVFRNLRLDGGLAGPAILFWRQSNNTIVENNTFIDNDRDIAFGLQDASYRDHTGGIIRNNMIVRTSANVGGDVAIAVFNSPKTQVHHNTVILNGDYPNAIEYRFNSTTDVSIRNNLTDGNIVSRNGGSATVSGNITNAQNSWFVNVNQGDLHLTSSATAAIDKATLLSAVPVDFDGDSRPSGSAPDVGADEYLSKPDTEAPAVSMTNPSSNQTVADTVSVRANASDNVGVVGVQFYLDGQPLGSEDASAPYSIFWDTTTTANGKYTLTAIARDAAGNTTTSAGTIVTVSNATSADGLLASYRFNDGKGLIATDSSNNGYNGTINGATWETGQDGGGLHFDGTNDYVDLGNLDMQPHNGQTGLTIGVWFKADQFGHLSGRDGRLVSKSTGSSAQKHYWMLSTDDSGTDTRLRFRLKTGTSTGSGTTTLIASSGNLVPNTWYHATATYDGARMRLYLNGQEVGNTAKTGTIAKNSNVPVWVGGNPGATTERPWSGSIDEVNLFNRALTPAEITKLLNGGLLAPDTTPPTVTGSQPANGATSVNTLPTVQVTFNEKIDASAINAANVSLIDSSGNAVDATLSLNNSTNVISLTPKALLANSAKYTVFVKGGNNGVKDLAGNTLEQDYLSTFTTAALAEAPSVSLGNNRTANEGASVNFSATVTGGEGTLDYFWEFSDGFTSTAQSPTHAFADNGSYTVSLTVTDSLGRSSSDSLTVNVSNVAPTAKLTDDNPIQPGDIVTIFFQNSTDPSSIDFAAGLKYSYDLDNDGVFEVSNSTNESITTTFDTEGSFTVRGKVSDKDGGSREYTTVIDVTDQLPLVGEEDLVYLGAFNGPSDEYSGYRMTLWSGGTAPAYNPANDSLFLVGHDHSQAIAEISIPEQLVISSDPDQLPTASILQPFRQIWPDLPNTSTLDSSSKIGGLLVVDDQLIGTFYEYYDGNASARRSHFRLDSLDLSRANVEGLFQVGNVNAGHLAGYMAEIPSEWQEALGAEYLTGLGGLSVAARASNGPSAFGFDPNALGANAIPATPYVDYPLEHRLGGGLYNGTTKIRGVFFAPETRSVLFFGRHGLGDICYGTGADCNDPYYGSKGYHSVGGNYAYYVWAYDVDDFVDVKNGVKEPWEIEPYDTWALDLPTSTGNGKLLGTAFDPSSGRLFVSQHRSGYGPVIHVYEVASGDRLRAASVGSGRSTATITSDQVDVMLDEAIRRWEISGADVSGLPSFDIRIGDFSGDTLALSSHHTIWVDFNAAGNGWFVDDTPTDDDEFLTPGDQGEAGRIDLLTTLVHEVGHYLGLEHEDGTVMQATLEVGLRRMPS